MLNKQYMECTYYKLYKISIYLFTRIKSLI